MTAAKPPTPAPGPNPAKQGIGGLIQAGGVVIGILVGSLGYAVLTGSFGGSFFPGQMASITSSVLLGMGIALGINWFGVGSTEGGMLDNASAGIPSNRPWYALPAIVIAGALFALLLVSSRVPPLFGAVLLAIKGAETVYIYLAAKRIEAGVDDAFQRTSLPHAQEMRANNSLAGWQGEAAILDRFFFGHPWYQLEVTYAVVVGVTSIIGTWLSLGTDASARDWGLAIATLGSVAAIVGNEVVAGIWRRQRDAEFAGNSETPGSGHKAGPGRHEHYPRL